MHCLFRVAVTPESSRLIQELAFEYGWCWPSQTVKHLDKPFLSFWSDKSIAMGVDKDFEDHHNHTSKEAILWLVGKFTPKPRLKPKEFHICGHKIEVYPKDKIVFGCTMLNKEHVEKLIKAFSEE